jgi:ABC-2 type transport system permease protein
MKYALLVAWREYAESTKAKGFWIGIFMMPLMLFLTIQVPILLEEKATPIRYFVLVDQSGSFAPVVNVALDHAYQKQVVEALEKYATKNVKLDDRTAARRILAALPQLDGDHPLELETFQNTRGKEKILDQLQPHLKPGVPPFREPRRLFQSVPLPPGIKPGEDLASLANDLKPYLRGEKKIEANGQFADLYVAILIPKDIESQIIRPGSRKSAPKLDEGESGATPVSQIQYWSTDVTPMKGGYGLAHDVEQAVNNEVRRREFLARGLDGAVVRDVNRTYAPFASLNPKKEHGQEAVNESDVIRQWAPSGFVYLLWLAIFVIVQMLLNNTIEEKSNRIIEVLLSSVTPGELMMGKLLGIASIGLTMVGAWMCALFGILSWKSGGASDMAGQILVILKSSNLLPLFSLYFLLGFLMYAAFILSIGSICNTLKEAQSYMGVFTMIMMVPLLTMTYIPRDPNGPLARLLSWIPLYTPFTMMNRAGADPPLFDLIGTFVLLVATTVLALWMSGKIFRIGILRTGQPPKILELIRWATRKQN